MTRRTFPNAAEIAAAHAAPKAPKRAPKRAPARPRAKKKPVIEVHMLIAKRRIMIGRYPDTPAGIARAKAAAAKLGAACTFPVSVVRR